VRCTDDVRLDVECDTKQVVQIKIQARDASFLLVLTAAAILVHGYHPAVEDAEIYTPGIKKILNPSLYPFGAEFFESHAHKTLFPNLIAASIRLSHLPFNTALFLWHVLSIFLLLLGCFAIGSLCFPTARARWAGVGLVAALLTIGVSGTALYIADQYLTPRSLSAPMLLFAIAAVLQKRYTRAGLWLGLTAVIHPLMSVFGICFAAIVILASRSREWVVVAQWFPPVSPAYHEALRTRPYFFLTSWRWYEWLGIFAPLLLLAGYGRIARKNGMPTLNTLCRSLVAFGVIFFIVALVITIPERFQNLAELQPMRCLHLIYILFFLITGGLLGEWVLRNRPILWLLLFAPLGLGMWYAQRNLFPSSPHLELPGMVATNDWISAFDWIRRNSPQDAIFSLNPDHMALPGEDQHGFRALAERSRLADNIKDSGAVIMFPALAETWIRQTDAQKGWDHFGLQDFERLKRDFGVDWVVISRSGVAGWVCPYENKTLMVCRLE
jgi:hypothetical protein